MTLITLAPPTLRAEDNIEKAGVAVGVSAGNMWFLPIKAIVMSVGAISGALSYVVTGGNAELTQQIWRDTTQGPYIITPEVARTGIGQRPELEERNNPTPRHFRFTDKVSRTASRDRHIAIKLKAACG
ncbi:MAG: hypothetical protein M3N35_05615, partial [Candidatus Binatota bacterium]|nr:hypothetical protein [Candidatus Binatota bacterium]